jgi:hypothetical protein
MKKILLGLIIALALSVTPAFAQRPGGSHATSHAGTTHSSAPRANATRVHPVVHPGTAWHSSHVGYNHRFYMTHRGYYHGYNGFLYGGFWFMWYDPWPVDWCDCDQVYIDYDIDTNCYFMYNYAHPGLRIRIGVIF